jgi:hypothetical protein
VPGTVSLGPTTRTLVIWVSEPSPRSAPPHLAEDPTLDLEAAGALPEFVSAARQLGLSQTQHAEFSGGPGVHPLSWAENRPLRHRGAAGGRANFGCEDELSLIRGRVPSLNLQTGTLPKPPLRMERSPSRRPQPLASSEGTGASIPEVTLCEARYARSRER